MTNIAIRLSVILLSVVVIYGQSISNLTTTHPVQATDSTVVITATALPPSSVISLGGIWVLDWKFNGVRVAQAGYAPYPTLATALEFSIYSSRINVSAASSSASSFTTQLTIARLRAEEDGYQVELGGFGVATRSIELTIRAAVMISTDPPYNPLATGFNNLLVTAQFSGSNNSPCSWYYGGELDGGSGARFNLALRCDTPAAGVYDRITCNEQTINGTNHVTTTLKITQPLSAGRLNITLLCIDATTPGTVVRSVQDCNSSLPFDVFVNTTSKTFNASGNFVCPNQGELFYSNGTMLTSNATTCRASAAWSGQIDLQCWTAPNVTLASISTEDGNLTVIEGNDLNLTCHYNDVIPVGNNSKFYVGDDHYFTTKEESYTLSSIQRSDNNKTVSCQAVTTYTDLYPASGRSSEYILYVLFAPQQNLVQVCNWNATQNGSCVVTFFSNPGSRFISLVRNGQAVTSDGSMTINAFGQMQTFEFYRTQVTSLDHGAYVLIVQSSNTFYFPKIVSISFEIKVSGTSPDNPAASGLSTGAIVGISCGAAVLILSVAAAYAYFKWRQAPNKKNNSAPTSTNMTSSRAIQDESDYIVPNKIENIPESQEQYAEVGPSIDNAEYIDLNKKFTAGGLKQNKPLEGPYEEVKSL